MMATILSPCSSLNSVFSEKAGLSGAGTLDPRPSVCVCEGAVAAPGFSGRSSFSVKKPLVQQQGRKRKSRLLCRAAAQTVQISQVTDSEPVPKLTSARAFAPATVANLGPGFDFLGCAVEGLGDHVTAEVSASVPPGRVAVTGITGDGGRLSLVAEDNCAGIAGQATLELLGVRSVGVALRLEKGLPLGSGLGSSAASAAAAAWAVNSLFGAPLLKSQLIPAGLASEAAVSGYHADNIAPAILGGFVLVRSYEPLQLLPLAFPQDRELWFVLVSPACEAPTREMRAVLPQEVSMRAHIANCSQASSLVAAILGGDAALLGSALSSDTIVEPRRGPLIPGFGAVKVAALAAGALGCTISGAGPTVCAIASSQALAARVGEAMQRSFLENGRLKSSLHVAELNREGARLV